MTDQDPRYQETTRTTVTEADPLRPGQPQHVETTETTTGPSDLDHRLVDSGYCGSGRHRRRGLDGGFDQ